MISGDFFVLIRSSYAICMENYTRGQVRVSFALDKNIKIKQNKSSILFCTFILYSDIIRTSDRNEIGFACKK